MKQPLEFTLRNQSAEITRFQDALEKFAAAQDLPRRPLHELQIALEEHLANIVNYGYADDKEHCIVVRLELNQGLLRVEVEDDARPFNPLECPDPDLNVPLDQRTVGGLGIYMMKKSVDEIQYRREAGRNHLVMLKRFTTPAP